MIVGWSFSMAAKITYIKVNNLDLKMMITHNILFTAVNTNEWIKYAISCFISLQSGNEMLN